MVPSQSRPTDGVSRRRALTVGGAALAVVAAALPLPSLGDAPGAGGGTAPSSDAAAESTAGPLARLHAAGVTGSGVDVAVLDPTGFDPGVSELRDRIAAVESFGADPHVVDGTNHGTAAATTVARVAPDAALHLAGFDRPADFERAVAWCRRRGVDVVLAPVAAHGVTAAAGSESAVVRAARAAVEAGLVVVAPTGNAARGHWARPVASGTLHADDRPGPRIHLRPLSGTGGPEGRLVAWVTHDGPAELGLELALVERTAGGDGRNLVALSEAVAAGRGERLTATLDGGDYWIELRPRGGDVDVAEGTGVRVDVTTPTHRLAPSHPAGSIAVPAAVRGVLAVGAADAEAGAAPYSGRGPTRDGRTGVDLVAPPRPWVGPRDAGTSAAAARAAGTVALVRGRLDASPRDVGALLRTTAAAAGRDDADLATGAGRLDPGLAVQRAAALARREGGDRGG